MRFINDFKYLIEVDFDCDNYLVSNLGSLVDHYNQVTKTQGFLDVRLRNTPLNNFFDKKIDEVVSKIFTVEKLLLPPTYNLYVQNNKTTTFDLHNHVHTPASICGVFYANLPQHGGELEIIHFPLNPPENPIKFKPKPNKIYFFPPWLYHKPSPQKDESPRICINFNYHTNNKPIVKGEGILW